MSGEARQKLAEIALSQVGTKETGGNNCGPKIREYQASTWLKPAAWPWCAAFTCWCIREWMKLPEVRGKLTDAEVEKWRPRTAGAWDYLRWAREKKLPILEEWEAVYAGDIVVFDFSHIGIVVEDASARSRYIQTVEGNTNGAGDRDSTTGDGVWRKARARWLAKNFIRLA